MTIELHCGDCRAILPTLAAGSVQTCITSPPYFGLRSYLDSSHADKSKERGSEPTPDEYIAALVADMREVRRVLRDDGTVFLNLGDSYAGSWGNQGRKEGRGTQRPINGPILQNLKPYPAKASNTGKIPDGSGLKPKDLCGIPWAVAFALRADGWWLRDAIVWAKAQVDEDGGLEGSAMPGSQRDRCTFAYEMVFQLAKRSRYYFDEMAIKTRSGATPRNVWAINPEPSSIPHYATFPRALVTPCILAGTSERGCCPHCGAGWRRVVEAERLRPAAPSGNREIRRWNGESKGQVGGRRVTATLGWQPSCTCPAHEPIPCTVLDPFAGIVTTGLVAQQHGRSFIGIELNSTYLDMARDRLAKAKAATPLFA